MARNDGIDRTSARNVNLTAAKIGNAQRHNEREKESYTNPDIIPERTPQNIHFKKPTAGYAEMFAQMEKDGVISTRGLKSDANLYGELIFDVNSAYFYNHGGYEFAKPMPFHFHLKSCWIVLNTKTWQLRQRSSISRIARNPSCKRLWKQR